MYLRQLCSYFIFYTNHYLKLLHRNIYFFFSVECLSAEQETDQAREALPFLLEKDNLLCPNEGSLSKQGVSPS